jgi:signal transduction histidine kinase
MQQKTLHVLVVEDNAADATLLRQMFRKESMGSFDLVHLKTMSSAVAHLAAGSVDIVLLDLNLPDGYGMDNIRRVLAVAPDVPVLVLTGLDDEDLAAEAMKEGAQDYLIKGQIENRALPRALRHAVERRRMQSETDLIRKQQLQLKDEFLSHVSHELRSPLTAIDQFASILGDGLVGRLNSEQLESVRMILKNSRQLELMIDDLLEVTRAQTGKLTVDLQRTSLPDAIRDIIGTFRGSAVEKGIGLFARAPSTLPLAYADPSRVRQVLTNLMDNALKFTPSGGRVELHAEVFQQNANFLQVKVSDTGCGMNPDMTERIFERLYQIPNPAEAGRKGLGLGLYICKELVDRMNGHIWAEGRNGGGSSVAFLVPVFSLQDLIAPILMHHDRPIDSLAVLDVEILTTHFVNGRRKLPERISRAVTERLQRCLLPDLDVLLPKLHTKVGGESFLVVAAANENGAEVLVKRIQEQLEQCVELKQTGLSYSVSFRLLHLAHDDAPSETELFLRKVTLGIEGLIGQTPVESSHYA